MRGNQDVIEIMKNELMCYKCTTTSLKEMGKKVTDRNHFKTVFCLDTIRLKTNSIS